MIGPAWTALALLLCLAHAVTLQEYARLESANPQSLLQELELSDSTPEGKHFPGLQKLVFLTPWNKKGFEYTLKYAHKLDYVSPCWYSLKLDKHASPTFENEHNYDQQYTTALRKTAPHLKLLPRVYVEGNDASFFQSIGTHRTSFETAVGLIARVVGEKGLDGIVWDSPFNFFERDRRQLNALIVDFLRAVRARLGEEKSIMFNMANPMNHMKKLEVDLYNQLPVDALLIQNYDTGDDYLTMVRSSIAWSQQLTKPIILMLPFFSVKVRVGSLSTEEAVRSLKRMGVAAADIHKGMCRFTENKTKRVFLIPCFSYFQEVFRLASAASASVGFWEGGNGLENYYKFL